MSYTEAVECMWLTAFLMSYTEVGRWFTDSLTIIPDGSKNAVVFTGFNTKSPCNYKNCAFVGELL